MALGSTGAGSSVAASRERAEAAFRRCPTDQLGIDRTKLCWPEAAILEPMIATDSTEQGGQPVGAFLPQ